jgi:L-cysteine desulfidase
MTSERELEFIELLKNEVKPALGCTEPIAVSLAVAGASEIIRANGGTISKVDVQVSANILKNGMGVGVPGTGMVGLHIAAALGVTCGKSKYGLEVLKDLDEESITEAKHMLSEDMVSIKLSDSTKKLYITANVYSSKGDRATVVIEDNHDNIVLQLFNDDSVDVLSTISLNYKNGGDCNKEIKDYNMDINSIYDFGLNVPLEKIGFIMESVLLNKALAKEGLEKDYGLKVGKTLWNRENYSTFGSGLLSYSMALTAAASDARMAGSTLPAMSNSGSGNQGITVTMPVIAFAEKLGSSDEELARALVISHLVAIHIKGYLGKLSALCGCVIASTGAACGIVFLKKGNLEQTGYAIKNMVGNLTGMVCDGAKVGCALKVASGVSSAVQAAILALDNICISDNDGIIENDVEKTIQNLGKIGSLGMQNTDNMILDIMINK